jgi:hypothetical protein
MEYDTTECHQCRDAELEKVSGYCNNVWTQFEVYHCDNCGTYTVVTETYPVEYTSTEFHKRYDSASMVLGVHTLNEMALYDAGYIELEAWVR